MGFLFYKISYSIKGIYNTAFSLGYLLGPLLGGGWLEFFSLPSLLVAYSLFILFVWLPALAPVGKSKLAR